MKIAQIAPLYEAVPPRLYGGTERVVASLCNSLSDLGHEVTLFAAAGSITQAQLVPVRDQALRLDPHTLKSDLAAHLNELWEVRRRAAQFDILHFHVDLLHLPLFEPLAHKTVTTLHGRLDLRDLPAAYARWPSFGLVSISESQRAALPNANWLATIPHGLPPPPHLVPPRQPGSYLAFLGRISPEKRPDLAIRLALRCGIPLRMAAKVDPADQQYFEAEVKPLLDHSLIDFVGEIGDEHKAEFLGNALALLFPIHWPEPFGLVMIEAMACGCPVIACNSGSVPEVIDDGVTGFVVSSEEEAIAAIHRAAELDRERIRAVFEKRFAASEMAKAYVEVYTEILHVQRLPARREHSRAAP
jgi:glycosyltransferase involved in cell wall biosynthesis